MNMNCNEEKEMLLSKSGGTRNISLDLMRTIATVMVINQHYLIGNLGGVLNNDVLSGLNYYIAWIAFSISLVAVNLFMLTTGYFSVNQKEIKLKKIFGLVLEVVFYSWLMYFLACVVGVQRFEAETMIKKHIFPIVSGTYWFISVYIAMQLFIPYINRALEHMDKAIHRQLIVTTFVLFSILPCIFFFVGDVYGVKDGYSLLWYVSLYVVGAYIRKYKSEIKKPSIYLLGYLLCVAITVGVKFIQRLVLHGEYINLMKYTSPTIAIGAICLFMFFSSIKIKENSDSKLIPILASCSLGVFVAHSSPAWSKWIWHKWIRTCEYIDKPYFIIGVILSDVLIFIIFATIELMRQKIFKCIKYGWNKLKK